MTQHDDELKAKRIKRGKSDSDKKTPVVLSGDQWQCVLLALDVLREDCPDDEDLHHQVGCIENKIYVKVKLPGPKEESLDELDFIGRNPFEKART